MRGSTSMSAYRPFGTPTCRVCGMQDTRHAGWPVGIPGCRHDSTPTPDRRPCTSEFRRRSEPDGRPVGMSAGRDSELPACASLAGRAARPASCSAYGCPVCRNVGLMRRHARMSGGPGATRRGTARCAAASEVPVFGAIYKHWMGARGWPSSVQPACRHAVVSECRPRGRELTPGLATGARGFVPPSCVPPCRRGKRGKTPGTHVQHRPTQRSKTADFSGFPSGPQHRSSDMRKSCPGFCPSYPAGR